MLKRPSTQMKMPKHIFLSLLCLLLLVPHLQASAQEIVGSWLRGNSESVVVAGDLMYVGHGEALSLVDVSDPANPVMRSVMKEPFLEVAAVDGYAFVAAGLDGMRIYDVSDPSSPVVVSTLLEASGSIFEGYEGGAFDLALTAEYAFVLSSGELVALDISNPAAPAEVGTLATDASFEELVLSGTRLYAADEDDGLHVFDVSDPTSPALLGATSDMGVQIAASGDYAFVDSSDVVKVVDLADPAAPSVVHRIELKYYYDDVEAITTAGDLLYLASTAGEVWVYDIADPASPARIGTYAEPYPLDVAVGGDRVYVAGDTRGTSVLDVSDPANLELLGTFRPGGETQSVAVEGTLALVGGTSTIDVLDISQPDQIQLLDRIEIRAQQLVIDGSYAFTGALEVLDLSDPSDVQVVAELENVSGSFGMDVENGLVAVTSGRGGAVQLVDVSSPEAPALVSEIEASGRDLWTGVDLVGEHMYVMGNDSLHIFDVASPSTPQQISAIQTGGSDEMGVAVNDGLAYVSALGGGFHVIDVSNPAQPSVLSTSDGYYEGASAVDGQHAFAIERDDVVIFDVTDPASPSEVASIEEFSNVQDLVVTGGYGYVADRHSGLFVFEHEATSTATRDATVAPAAPRLGAPYPNPFFSQTRLTFSLPRSMHAMITVHDMLGRRVATLLDERRSAGEDAVRLDGGSLAAGVYVVTLRAGGRIESRRVVHVE